MSQQNKDIKNKYPKNVLLKFGVGPSLKFYAPNEKCMWRYSTLLDKEPETIEWLDSLSENDILWDVGANIGIYSLYASQRKKLKVMAFEPAAANYWLLNKNIQLNQAHDRVSAYLVALADKSKFERLYLRKTEFGAALNVLHQPVTDYGDMFGPEAEQGVFSCSIDDAVINYDLPSPTAIKIDVDGLEFNVLQGGKKILSEGGLRKIQLETNSDNIKQLADIICFLKSYGYKLIAERRSKVFLPNSSIHNYQFVKMG